MKIKEKKRKASGRVCRYSQVRSVLLKVKREYYDPLVVRSFLLAVFNWLLMFFLRRR